MNGPVGMLIDVTRCKGCERCVEACKQVNHLGPDQPRRWQRRIDDLSSTRFTTLDNVSDERSVRVLCRHCVEPACVSACIVGALQKTPIGAVTYDVDRCIGCRYCMMACPYGIPRYAWANATPQVRKCTLCYPRISQGQLPACVEACPYDALSFGTRDEMLAEGHDRILREPGRYLPRVWGENEIGGTSVLYVSDISLDFLAFKPDMGDRPLPALTWEALSKVPPIVAGGATLLTGIWWVIQRRMKLQADGSEPEDEAPGEHGGES
ncbi:MAG: 4Fe-4S dicluster domain-containing protein [Acidobacteriota bacterium]